MTPDPPPLGVIDIDIDPVLHIGPLPIHWYGIMYAVAFYVAWRFGVLPLAKRAGLSRSVADRITTWTIVFGLLGGRLYYVLQQPDLVSNYLLKPVNIIAFWNGGMAFFGAIIAGFITLAACAWRYRVNPWVALDGGVLFAVIGQPIGRIGNIINGDILGPQSNLPWATAYTNENAILQCPNGADPNACHVLGVPYVPAAAYEALAAVGIGVILFVLYQRRARPGVMAITYVALYAVSQLLVFQYRTSEPTVLLGLHQAQWTAIGMLVIGVPGLYLLWRRTADRFGATAPVQAAGAASRVADEGSKAKAPT